MTLTLSHLTLPPRIEDRSVDCDKEMLKKFGKVADVEFLENFEIDPDIQELRRKLQNEEVQILIIAPFLPQFPKYITQFLTIPTQSLTFLTQNITFLIYLTFLIQFLAFFRKCITFFTQFLNNAISTCRYFFHFALLYGTI